MGRRSRDMVMHGEVQRGARGTETWSNIKRWWDGQSHIHTWWLKIGRVTLVARGPSSSPDHPAQGSRARKISPHNFWL